MDRETVQVKECNRYGDKGGGEIDSLIAVLWSS